MNQKRIFKTLKYILLGGFAFWTPSMLLHWFRGNRFSGRDILTLTAVLPLTTLLFFIIGRKMWGRIETRVSEALFALLGIWLFGPMMMSISFTFGGGGFSKPEGWGLVLIGTSLFPIFTFMMSTYDGTLGALLLTTALLPLFSILSVKRKTIPKISAI